MCLGNIGDFKPFDELTFTVLNPIKKSGYPSNRSR